MKGKHGILGICSLSSPTLGNGRLLHNGGKDIEGRLPSTFNPPKLVSVTLQCAITLSSCFASEKLRVWYSDNISRSILFCKSRQKSFWVFLKRLHQDVFLVLNTKCHRRLTIQSSCYCMKAKRDLTGTSAARNLFLTVLVPKHEQTSFKVVLTIE